MKKNFSLILMALATLALVSCQKNDSKDVKIVANQETAEANTENVVEFLNDTYQGSLPCADCAGINTTLVLNQNGTYIMGLIYDTNEGDTFYYENGTWKEEDNKLILTSKESNISYISMASNNQSVTFLDQEGNVMDTNLNYTLVAVTPSQKTGQYIYYADAPIFIDDTTNQQYFAPGIALETAYLASEVEAGTPVYAEIEGYYSLAPSMEEGQFTPVLIQTGNINFQEN